MSKKVYNLLREKNKLERKRDEILSEFLLAIVNWSWGGADRLSLYNKYTKSMEELRIIQQHLELELANELSDKGEFWTKKE